MRLFLGALSKENHFSQPPPAFKDPTYNLWHLFDMAILNSLINSMEPHTASTITFQKSTKVAWDFLNTTYTLH